MARKTLWILLCAAAAAFGRTERYIVILEDPPVAAMGGKLASRAAVAEHESRIRAAQQSVAGALRDRKVIVHGTETRVLNALFVEADEAQVASMESTPGVSRVHRDLKLQRQMVRALELHRAAQGWAALPGGEANAGAGVRIAIIDSGIDQQHPAFQDPSLPMPAGYPRCRDFECPYTNNKVIVARSYVELLEKPTSIVADWRPDDRTPRDRVGHGTAVAMVAVGARHQSPLGPMSGVAPKAYVGNYKIFGSPGVNDFAFTSAMIRALGDASDDGMQIAVLSLGAPADYSPFDRGAVCNRDAGLPCDPRADAVANATSRGLLVVVAGGNDGNIGVSVEPAYNSIASPGTAPAALTVGATTNAQRYRFPVRVTGDGVPPALQQIPSLFGNGPVLLNPLTAPLRDVAAIQDGGEACSPLPTGSMAGAIAILQRGQSSCRFSTKVLNAQRAGAVGAIVVQRGTSDFIFPITGLEDTAIPAVMIGATAGAALREFVAGNPDRQATLDPTPAGISATPSFVAAFSSFGPSIGNGAIKPEVAGTGDSLYMATQKLDPNGDMYSPSGWVAAQGTSFSAPIAAGAAALFKQRFPQATPEQMKSAVVNTASGDAQDVDSDGRPVRASVAGVGAGRINLEGVARTNVTTRESVLSFGYATTATFPLALPLNIVNLAGGAQQLRLEANPSNPGGTRIAFSESTFSLGAGATRTVTVQVQGNRPVPGRYEGEVTISGGAVPLRVPYMFTVSDLVAANAIPYKSSFEGEVEGRVNGLFFKLVDKYGAPVRDVPVTWRAGGGGSIRVALRNTDSLGIGDAGVVMGPNFGEQRFVAEAGGFQIPFTGLARLRPTIATDGVVNAASNQIDRGAAPGSYVAIYGRSLSDSFRQTITASLPYSLARVSVSFDTPDGQSYAGRLHFVSEQQINVQVPWELQGNNTALVKVSLGDFPSARYELRLNDAAPAAFEIPDPSGRQIAAALDESFRLITTQNPLRRGRPGQIYCNGLGPVGNQPATGEPSPAEPLAATRVQPTVTIGGRPAQVLFSGLTPSTVGLYQINIIPASDTPTGIQPVEITVNGISSKTVSLPIQ